VLLYGGGGGISGTVVTFRGIPNVGTYVDGVWQVSNAGLLQRQFVDLEQVHHVLDVIQPGAQITENTEFGGSPDRTTDGYVQYAWNLGGGTLSTRFSANYWGSYWRSSIPSFREDAYGGNTQSGDFWTTSARLTYTPANGNYEVSVWGNNLNNAYNINSGFMDSIWQFDFAGVDAPREAGVTLKMRL
jgi:hypothetical protein